ncbi:unnamed protein product [Ectocarpus sp. 13 AM-2016]
MPSADMFHERQYIMHCAVHTLNNLFQESWATASLMEDIAKELFNREASMRKESGMGRMWVNPYKSVVPQVGYYDINCLLEALKLKKCHVSLHAVFNPKEPNAVAKSLEHLDPSLCGVRGIVVNRVSKSLLGGLYTTHHFYAIIPYKGDWVCIGGDSMAWYVVDSKADAPEIIGSAAELALHLGMEAREHQGHVFVVSDGECEVMAGDSSGGGGDSGKQEEKTAGGSEIVSS